MLELAERCEKATGPDRALDMQIEIAVNPAEQWIVGEKPGRWPRDPVYGTLADLWEWATDETKEPPEINAPNFTASIDAAMTLVPEGCDWRMINKPWHATIDRDGLISQPLAREAATPALALCAAALRARAADTPKEQSNG